MGIILTVLLAACLAFAAGIAVGRHQQESGTAQVVVEKEALSETSARLQEQLYHAVGDRDSLQSQVSTLNDRVAELTEERDHLVEDVEGRVAEALRLLFGEEQSPAHLTYKALLEVNASFAVVVERAGDLFDLAEKNRERLHALLVGLGIVAEEGQGEDEDGTSPFIPLPGSAVAFYGGKSLSEAAAMLRELRVALASDRFARFQVEWLPSLLDTILSLGARYLDELADEAA